MALFTWNIDPEIFRIGTYALRWYSLLFAGCFVVGHAIAAKLLRDDKLDQRTLDSGLVYAIIGTLIFARLAHCLLYEPAYYLANPLEILKVWQGGLASHGGFFGAISGFFLATRQLKALSFGLLMDRCFLAMLVSAGMIRLGNFFNSEILGRGTDAPWAIIFARIDQVPRHPAQLYEAGLYFVAFAVLYAVWKRTDIRHQLGAMSGWVLISSTLARIVVEFSKENQAAFENGMPINMGQILSLPYLVIGVLFVLGVPRRFAWYAEVPRAKVVAEATAETETHEHDRKEARKLRRKANKRGAA